MSKLLSSIAILFGLLLALYDPLDTLPETVDNPIFFPTEDNALLLDLAFIIDPLSFGDRDEVSTRMQIVLDTILKDSGKANLRVALVLPK